MSGAKRAGAMIKRSCGRHPERAATHIAGNVNMLGMFLCPSCARAHDFTVRYGRTRWSPGWTMRCLGLAHAIASRSGRTRSTVNP